MTRALQNRLALASVKIQNGWDTTPLDTLEPRIELELKRKRPGSSNCGLSDTSSSVSERYVPAGHVDSSPLTAPIFSDDGPKSGSSRSSKRSRHVPAAVPAPFPSRKRPALLQKPRAASHSYRNSWKRSHRLPESSPSYRSHSLRLTTSQHGASLSLVSEVSTVPDGAFSVSHSEDDDSDLPLHPFHRQIRSSPPRIPRTPSPDVARSARLRSRPFNAASRNEDADLLMFLATSPSPAVPGKRMNPPSTPPPAKTPLPSSMLNTPGGGSSHLVGFGAATPGMWADFVNFTPSPAQAAWRTPGAAAKTPLAAREARRRLNFDSLMPPSNGASPELLGAEGKVNGLGMELGGELVSSQ